MNLTLPSKANRVACGLLASTFMVPVTAPSFAQDKYFSLEAKCRTQPTPEDGKAKICEDTQCAQAPTGFVVRPQSLEKPDETKSLASGACTLGEDWQVEILPDSGIQMPRRVCLKATANSPEGTGNKGLSAWIECRVNGDYLKYQNR